MNALKAAQRFWEMRASWLGDGGQPVTRTQAQERANVCLSCPFNQPGNLYEIFATEVANLVKRQIELKNSLALRVDGEKSLHICDACDCVLRLKVHVPLQHIITTPLDKLHQDDPKCSIISEKEQQ